jgi:hypothetical protein
VIALSPHGGKVALTCPDDNAQGDTLEVVWAVELDAYQFERLRTDPLLPRVNLFIHENYAGPAAWVRNVDGSGG